MLYVYSFFRLAHLGGESITGPRNFVHDPFKRTSGLLTILVPGSRDATGSSTQGLIV